MLHSVRTTKADYWPRTSKHCALRCNLQVKITFQGKIAPNRFALKIGLNWVELGQNKERTVARQGGGGISESSWISELRQLPS